MPKATFSVPHPYSSQKFGVVWSLVVWSRSAMVGSAESEHPTLLLTNSEIFEEFQSM